MQGADKAITRGSTLAKRLSVLINRGAKAGEIPRLDCPNEHHLKLLWLQEQIIAQHRKVACHCASIKKYALACRENWKVKGFLQSAWKETPKALRRAEREARLLEADFSNRKYAGKSNQIHLSYTWHFLGSALWHSGLLVLIYHQYHWPLGCVFFWCLASIGIKFKLHNSSVMNWKGIPLITVTETVNSSFLSSWSLQSLDLSCAASFWHTKLSQGTQICISQTFKFHFCSNHICV